ncbi:MAG: hypothetical protein ACO3RV_01205, partial [Luteolibacter sp.]
MQATLSSRETQQDHALAEFAAANRWHRESGRDYAVFDHLERHPPFFLSIVGSGEQWLFCSSHGSLTAGRQSADWVLFPYDTEDKITDNWNTTGPWTAIRCGDEIWEPFRPTLNRRMPVRRMLMKSSLGDEVVFREVHDRLGLEMRYSWRFSPSYGFVRKARLINHSKEQRSLRLVDGLDHLMPAGVDRQVQMRYSCLADAYKITEQMLDGMLVVHRLAAGITDTPIPLECLRATTVWTHGLGAGITLTNRKDAERYLHGKNLQPSPLQRGKRGAMILAREIEIHDGDSIEWSMCAEIGQSHAQVATLVEQLQDPTSLMREVEADIAAASAHLESIVCSADGIQRSADRDVCIYHYHNTLANLMRGGIPESANQISIRRWLQHLGIHNRNVLQDHAEFFTAQSETIPRSKFLALTATPGDLDLERIANEYLPLILSRRHGDPSRPWNQFLIRTRDEDGNTIHHFEGNWRDIFQNWEALAWSYPGYLTAFMAKFLNASTIDGFNPYRISSQGIDWEVPDPSDPWSSIGYWGDHQIVYLLKFLELAAKLLPDELGGQLDRPAHVYADVPYRLKSWHSILEDPRSTIEFDGERHDELMARKKKIGADGLLLRDSKGELVRATLAEKLLLPAVNKLANFIPGGGIGMNTQRPEWNDANNALAGCGVSLVTACYLRRYLNELLGLFGADHKRVLHINVRLVELIEALHELIRQSLLSPDAAGSPTQVFSFAETAGQAIDHYRQQVYQNAASTHSSLTCSEVLAFLNDSIRMLDATLHQNRRDDSLWHSYHVLVIDAKNRRMKLRNLPLMLEGQVAILSSGILSPSEGAELLEALERSDLRSEYHQSYLLYPDREPTPFLEINRVDTDAALEIPLIRQLVDRKDTSLVILETSGEMRFHPDLVNVYALRQRLDQLANRSDLADSLNTSRSAIESLYEATFNHHAFTGRSGSMFAYEGLGCIYWHMISKLMLAAQEVLQAAIKAGADVPLQRRLIREYYSIQRGLGFR